MSQVALSFLILGTYDTINGYFALLARSRQHAPPYCSIELVPSTHYQAKSDTRTLKKSTDLDDTCTLPSSVLVVRHKVACIR